VERVGASSVQSDAVGTGCAAIDHGGDIDEAEVVGTLGANPGGTWRRDLSCVVGSASPTTTTGADLHRAILRIGNADAGTLYLVVAGSIVASTAVTIASGGTYTVKVVVGDTSIQVYLDGVEEIDYAGTLSGAPNRSYGGVGIVDVGSGARTTVDRYRGWRYV
jgi:hypothetical protein